MLVTPAIIKKAKKLTNFNCKNLTWLIDVTTNLIGDENDTNWITKKGFKALVDALGIVDAIRFIQQYDSGSGDYTKQRHLLLDRLTVDDILADIERRQQNPKDSQWLHL